jgi:hypothetical protein
MRYIISLNICIHLQYSVRQYVSDVNFAASLLLVEVLES